MFRYRRNNKGMFDNLDDPGGFPLREQDIKSLRDNNIPFEIVDEKRKAGDIFEEVQEADLGTDLEQAYEFLTEPIQRKSSRLDDDIEALDIKLQAFKAIDDALVNAGVNSREFNKKIQVGKGKNKRGENIRTLKRLDTGELRGGVPGPYIKTTPTHETRVHVRRGSDGELRPIVDQATGEAMKPSVFGMLDIHPMTYDGPDMTANEMVGMQAARLMEEGPVKQNKQYEVIRNRDGSTSKREKSEYADIKQGREKVDLMVVGRGGNYDNTINTPRYMGLHRTAQFNLADEVEFLRGQGFTTETAVKELARKRMIEPITKYSLGKLAKADIDNVNGDIEGVYDALLVSGYPRKLLNDSRAIKKGWEITGTPHELADKMATDRLALAPETLHKVDLPGLRKAIDRGEIKTDLFSNVNTGVRVNGDGRARDTLQETIPQQDNPYIDDLTVSHPYTQQLLRKLPYV